MLTDTKNSWLFFRWRKKKKIEEHSLVSSMLTKVRVTKSNWRSHVIFKCYSNNSKCYIIIYVNIIDRENNIEIPKQIGYVRTSSLLHLPQLTFGRERRPRVPLPPEVTLSWPRDFHSHARFHTHTHMRVSVSSHALRFPVSSIKPYTYGTLLFSHVFSRFGYVDIM